jgi:hypothetical protein
MVEPVRPKMTTCRNYIACWITKVTNTHSKYVNTYCSSITSKDARKGQCYLLPTLPILFIIHSYNRLGLIHLSPDCNINKFSRYFISFQTIWWKIMITFLSGLVHVIRGTVTLNGHFTALLKIDVKVRGFMFFTFRRKMQLHLLFGIFFAVLSNIYSRPQALI